MDRRPTPDYCRRRGFTVLELIVVLAILVITAAILIMKAAPIRDNADATTARATLTTMREAIVGSPAAPGFLTDMKYMPGFQPVNDLTIPDLLKPASEYPLAQQYDIVAQRGRRSPYLDNILPVQNFTTPALNGLFPGPGDSRWSGDKTFFQRGFYTTNSSAGSPYGTAGDRAAADQWGNPLVLQIPPASAFTNSTDAKRFRYARLVSAGKDGVLDTPLNDRLAGMTANGDISARGDDIVIFLNRADIYEPEEP